MTKFDAMIVKALRELDIDNARELEEWNQSETYDVQHARLIASADPFQNEGEPCWQKPAETEDDDPSPLCRCEMCPSQGPFTCISRD